MTQKEILTLAYHGALQRWGQEHRYFEAMPENELAKARDQKAWETLEEISKLLAQAEQAEVA